MPKWTEYTSKDTLADNDEVMLYDATAKANKRGLMSKFWNYVVDKMATAVISKLETNNKTIIGAINALNSDKLSKGNLKIDWLYYSDTESSTIGGLTACVKDAVDNNKIPKEGIFFCFFTCRLRYLMLGYRYEDGKFGTIILYGFDNNTYRYNIKNGVFSAS